MSGRNDRGARRRLALKRETVRKLSAADLGRVAGGTDFTAGCWADTDWCGDTSGCWLGTGSRLC